MVSISVFLMHHFSGLAGSTAIGAFPIHISNIHGVMHACVN